MRRLVRSAGVAMTARISSSVCRLPLMSISTVPAAASSAARAAAAWLWSTASMWTPVRSMPSPSAIDQMRASGPISHGTISPRRAAAIAPASEVASHGCTTPHGIGACPASPVSSSAAQPSTHSASRAAGSNRCMVGSAARGRLIFCSGARTIASPLTTTAPAWFVTTQSSVRRWRSSSRAVTVAWMVSVSPARTGRWKRSICAS